MKKKLKKFLKRALPVAALAAGAGMLARRNQMRDFLATEGGDISNMTSRPNMADIAGAVSQPKNVSSTLPKKRNMKSLFVGDDGSITKGDMTFANKNEYANFMRNQRRQNAPLAGLRVPGQSMASPNLNTGAFDIGLKDGGKVVKTGEKVAKRKKKIGIQIRGFGKARK